MLNHANGSSFAFVVYGLVNSSIELFDNFCLLFYFLSVLLLSLF